MNVNLDQKVVVKNLTNWDLYFKRIESSGDVKIPAKGINRLSVGEIQAQVFAGNTMFTGVDGKGTHAKVYIDDKDVRVMLGFESADGTEQQEVLSAEKVAKIIEAKNFTQFKKMIEENVVLDSEKLVLVEEAKKLGLNDHKKIQFIEKYTGYKFDK